MSFQEILKNLSRQAQQERLLQEKQKAEQNKNKIKQQDINFSDLMKDVIPLKNANKNYTPPPDHSPIKPRPKDNNFDNENRFYIGESGILLDIPNTFSKNGQGTNDIKRLLNGHYEVVADVDLHGYTQEKAQEILNEFIEFVQRRGVCGEIIHGSGLGSTGYTPVLKNMVRRWLMQHPDVLAYAQPSRNNDGAVRILIKRPRRIDPFDEEK